MKSGQKTNALDRMAAQIINGEVSATASLVDVLTAWGVAMPNKRARVIGAIMAFVDGASVQDGHGKNGEDFRTDNPQLSAALDATFNQEMPLFGFKRYAREDEERAQALIFSPLAAFYNLPTTTQGRGEKKPRTDKGKKHTKRKYADGWRKQEEVAADFNKARFIPEKGAKPKGGCILSKIKQWDAAYPNATHAQPICGYCAELRTNPDLKGSYYKALAAWREYWQGWRKAFKGWRETHKASPIGAFRYRQAKIVSGYCPDLIGMDADGKQYGTPDGKKKPRKA